MRKSTAQRPNNQQDAIGHGHGSGQTLLGGASKLVGQRRLSRVIMGLKHIFLFSLSALFYHFCFNHRVARQF